MRIYGFDVAILGIQTRV